MNIKRYVEDKDLLKYMEKHLDLYPELCSYALAVNDFERIKRIHRDMLLKVDEFIFSTQAQVNPKERERVLFLFFCFTRRLVLTGEQKEARDKRIRGAR